MCVLNLNYSSQYCDVNYFSIQVIYRLLLRILLFQGEERVKYYLGMGPPGLSVFRDTTRVSYYVW